MDRLAWTAMTGAKQLMLRQDVVTQNLANASTPGYRAATSAARAEPVQGAGQPTRVFTMETVTGADLSPGPLQATGRDLDVAIEGEGWLAVQGADGREAYTRNGSLQVGQNGTLETRGGLAVMGEGGPLAIPPDHAIRIARDGTVSAIPNGQPPTTLINVGRIKLVNPPAAQLARGDDGLFRLRGGDAPADPSVALAGGTLEASNVNAPEALVSMVSLARQFELHMKLLTQAEDNARKASSLLNLTA